MEIAEQLERRVVEQNDLSRAHPRPWLRHLVEHLGRGDILCEATQRLLNGDYRLVSAVCLTSRLKPDTQARDFAFVPVEVELAMMAQAAELVSELDGPARRPCSFATPADFGQRPYWTLESFNAQRRPGGAYSQYKSMQATIRGTAPHIAATDIRRYFSTLSWKSIVRGTAYACAWAADDVARSLAILGQVQLNLQGRHPGLPVGLDLSYVVGNALLSQADDLLRELALGCLVARWLDDIAFGVPALKAGYECLEQLARGPCATLRVELHPGKTQVLPSWAWEPSPTSVISLDTQQPPVAALDQFLEMEGPPSPLPRPRARGLVAALETLELDPEQEAEILADHAAELTLAMHETGQRLRSLLGDPIPANIADRFVASCARTPPGSAWEGEVSEHLLHLERWKAQIGPDGRQHLRRVIVDQNRGERARVAAGWTLARRGGEFCQEPLDRLNTMSIPAARGVVASAHVAGSRPRTFHLRQAALR